MYWLIMPSQHIWRTNEVGALRLVDVATGVLKRLETQRAIQNEHTHTQYKPYHSFTVIIVLMIFWGIPGKPWLPFIHGPGMICFTYDQWRLRLWWWDRPSWVTWSNKFQNVGVYPNLILNSKIWIQRVSNHNSNVARAQIFGLYDKLWSDM